MVRKVASVIFLELKYDRRLLGWWGKKENFLLLHRSERSNTGLLMPYKSDSDPDGNWRSLFKCYPCDRESLIISGLRWDLPSIIKYNYIYRANYYLCTLYAVSSPTCFAIADLQSGQAQTFFKEPAYLREFATPYTLHPSPSPENPTRSQKVTLTKPGFVRLANDLGILYLKLDSDGKF